MVQVIELGKLELTITVKCGYLVNSAVVVSCFRLP